MTKQEYMEIAIELAARCKLFAEKPCRELSEETLICNCDKYGHALGVGYETFTIRREHNRVKRPIRRPVRACLPRGMSGDAFHRMVPSF